MTLFLEIWAVCFAAALVSMAAPFYINWFIEVLRDPMA